MRIRLGLGLGLSTLAVAGPLWAAEGDLAGLRASPSIGTAPIAWQYDGDQGPSHWGELAPTTVPCEKGTHQSPINIRTAPHHQSHDGLLVHYTAAPGHVVTSHHTIEVNFQSSESLEVLGRTYTLKELHLHEPSEHQLNGRTYPMEAHLMHRDETGHLVVLAVLMDLGTESASLSAVWDRIPSEKQEEARGLLINP